MRPEKFPGVLYTHGISPRKVRILRRFAGLSRIRKLRTWAELAPGSSLILWGATPVPADCPGGVAIIRLEDGFLRSVGLGADLIRPLSWVFDSRGIYFDPTRPSDLEHLLETSGFDGPILGRARALRERVVASNLTKYNVGNREWRRPEGRGRVILVPGQVESDASIRLGAPGVNTNMGLLRAVRQANPDAHIVYKPHPDVLAGLRIRGRDENQALHWCDEQVTDVSMGALLPLVDELHTMTSLAGFEALLRGKSVTCYGQPFYAGWGLTTDILSVPRRERRLTLDELVAGTLILYPTYIRHATGAPATPEQALDDLLEWSRRASAATPWWRRIMRAIRRRVEGVR